MNIVKQAAKERLQLEQQLAHSKSREVRLVSPAFLPRALRFLLRVFHVLACRFSCTVRSCVSCTVLVFPVLYGLVVFVPFSPFLYCTVLCFLYCSLLSCTVRSCVSCTLLCTVLLFSVLFFSFLCSSFTCLS